MAKIINGNLIARKIEKRVKTRVLKINPKPKLVVIQVGSDPSSTIYVNHKRKACSRVGIDSKTIRIGQEDALKAAIKGKCEVKKVVEELNKDKKTTSILIQLPLPKGLDADGILATIDPVKDVDCLNSQNLKNVGKKGEKIIPCTPKGILYLIKEFNIKIKAKTVVIVGRSNIVGFPLIKIFNSWGVKVISCNRKTKNLADKTKRADIIITAVGQPNLIKSNMVKKGVIVFDVGITRKQGKVYGDVEYAKVKKISSLITPVPGGIGPITVAELLENVLICWGMQHQQKILEK